MSVLFESVTTLSICLKLSLSNGEVVSITDHDHDLIVDGLTYTASRSFSYTNIESHSSLNVDNLQIDSVLNSDYINKDDILAGKYDGAEVEIFQVDYNNQNHDKSILKFGFISEIKILDNRFIANIVAISQNAKRQIADTFSPFCRAKFCDHLCKLKIDDFSYHGYISEVLIKRKKFLDKSLKQEKDYYKHGVITFLSGANKPYPIEIKESVGSEIELFFLAPYEIKCGDKYTIIAGCDKLFSTCNRKFKNGINFRGEPHIPEIQKLLQPIGGQL